MARPLENEERMHLKLALRAPKWPELLLPAGTGEFNLCAMLFSHSEPTVGAPEEVCRGFSFGVGMMI